MSRSRYSRHDVFNNYHRKRCQFDISLRRNFPPVYVIKSRRLRWAGHVAKMEEGRSAFKILTGKTTGKRPLGRPRRR